MKLSSTLHKHEPGHGSAEMLRESIAEALSAVVLHAQHGSEYALIGADDMLKLSVHHALCCLRAAFETQKDLNELNARKVCDDGSR